MNKLNSKRKHKMMNKLKKNRKKQRARDQPLRNLFMSNLYTDQFMVQCMVQYMNQSKDLFNRKMKIRKKFKLISLTTKLLFITKAKNH